jgi:triacylglycerol lipase
MLKYIFVHGLSGWGSYDQRNNRTPYWGMRNGDYIKALNEKGYPSYAASIDPAGSAWDRACELYAQLTGTRTDYGKSHSLFYRHKRFGPDFTGRPLIENWDKDTKLVLIGHSFGGATIRSFVDLMINGDKEEQKTKDCSDFFKGGNADKIHAIVTLASPLNGTSAYDLTEDPNFDMDSIEVPWWSKITYKIMKRNSAGNDDNRDKRDYAAWDMHIDQAMKWNEKWKIHPDIYYFSIPFSITRMDIDGCHKPILKEIEPLYTRHAYLMGAWTGTTRGGINVDEKWLENDGLVNTVSARAPINDPQKKLDENDIQPGIWNVFDTVHGDHMSVQGGLTRKKDIFDLYIKLLEIIPKEGE